MGDYDRSPLSRNEEILKATIDGTEYKRTPMSAEEELLLELKEAIESGGGGGGSGVTSFNGRSGSVLPIGGDYSAEMISYKTNSNVKSAIDDLDTKTTGMSDGYVQVGATIFGIPRGMWSTVEGTDNAASGTASHAEGRGNVAGNNYQTVVGSYNDKSSSDTLFEVGNGTSSNARSNAFEVYKNGHVNVNGDIYQNGVKIATGIFTTPVSALVGDTTVTITNNAIKTTSMIFILGETASGKPFIWNTCTVPQNGQAVLTFPALTEATNISLLVM